MIEDIVFENVQYYELQLDSTATISYSMAIVFGSGSVTDIIPTEIISII
jgi:hypothetical protein